MSKPYTIEYFIQKFSAIPDDEWLVGAFRDKSGRCCALGHCGLSIESDFEFKTPESRALQNILEHRAAEINDSIDGREDHLGATPKERILTALRKAQVAAK